MGTPQHPLNHSKGCGGVMRTAPLGFFPEKIGGSALKNGADAAAITHGHPMGYIPAAYRINFICHICIRLCSYTLCRSMISGAVNNYIWPI